MVLVISKDKNKASKKPPFFLPGSCSGRVETAAERRTSKKIHQLHFFLHFQDCYRSTLTSGKGQREDHSRSQRRAWVCAGISQPEAHRPPPLCLRAHVHKYTHTVILQSAARRISFALTSSEYEMVLQNRITSAEDDGPSSVGPSWPGERAESSSRSSRDAPGAD